MNIEQPSIDLALSLHRWSKELLLGWGATALYVDYLNLIVLTTYLILILYFVDFIFRRLILKYLLKLINKSSTKFDDYLVQNKTFVFLSRLVLIIIAKNLSDTILIDFKDWIKPVKIFLDILLLLNWYFLARAVLRTLKDHLSTTNSFRDKPLGSYLQVANMVLVFVVAIILFTLVTGNDPWKFLGAFGAASAIIMLIFKDTILGFVASIQVSVNDMVRIGDWIEMPKYNADGDVIEINLNTVKIQNWDKTITTIPTYYLVTDSFKNWRGMQNSGGRRIKRAVFIKISSIRYLKEEEISQLKKIQLLAPFITARQAEIEAHNEKTGADKSMPINGRNLTNAGLFREYINQYIRHHPHIRQDMTLLVRQLAPTEHGLPIELYLFTSDIRWAYYENIMSDIFDHLFAAIKFFHLEVFEAPASDDLRKLHTGPATSSPPTDIA